MIAFNAKYKCRILVYFLLCSLLTLLCPAAVLATPILTSTPNPLIETTLNGSTVQIELTNADGQFSVLTSSTLAFILNNAPVTTIVSAATINTVTSATLTLNYDGTVFTHNIPNFSVSVDQSILVTGSTLTTNNINILTAHGVPNLLASSVAPLQESTLNNSTVNLELEYEQFKDSTLARSNFVLNNAPAGLTVGGVVYGTVTSASLILSYDGTDFFNDYPNFSVTVSGPELASNLPLTSNVMTIHADTSAANANLSDLRVNGSTVTNFTTSGTAYTYTLPAGTTTIPVVAGTTQDPHATMAVTQAASLNGDQVARTATAVVTAQDGLTQKTYTVTFSRSPQVLSTVPADLATNINENAIYSQTINGTTYYFLQVVFADLDGSLSASSNLLNLISTSNVYAEGGSLSSVIDRDLITYISSLQDPTSFINQYIFVSGAGTKTLNIPIRKLGSSIRYLVELNPGLVQYSDGAANQAINWSFSTMSLPSVTTVSIGSVSEDYDESVPITLEGSNFNSNVSVYFNNTSAYRVNVKTHSDGSQYLEVYLPRGGRHLVPGIYTLKIKNGTDHEVSILGNFCVVAASSLPAPSNGERIVAEDALGTVVEKSGTSETSLELSSSYVYNVTLDIDLDALMGTDVFTRKIILPQGSQARIGALRTYSKWANVAIYGLNADTSGTDKSAYVKLGRANYSQASALRSKLGQYSVKSDFFEVGGEFYRADSVEIHLPYHMSDGKTLKLMRYDPSSRSFQQVSAIIDTSSSNIIAGRVQPGIFVAVE